MIIIKLSTNPLIPAIMKKRLISAGIVVLLVFIGLDESNGQWSYNGTHIYNTNSGNVGIGTNNPGTLLFVSKLMTEPTITVRNAGGSGGATYSMIDVTSGADWKFKATQTGGFKIRDHANAMDIMIFEPSSAPNSIYIKTGGNIGMGTNEPNAKLHIYHSARGLIVDGTGGISSTTFQGLGFQYYWPSGEGAIQASYPGGYGYLTFHTTFVTMAERMRINTLGNVGIGTTNPTSILHVVRSEGTTATAAQIVNSEDADNANGLYINTTRTTSGANILNLASGGTSRMYARSDGHVGINTTNPGSLLHVYLSGNASSYLGYNNVSPNYFYHYQLPENGAGQCAVYGYKASSNDGTGYATYTANSAVKGYSYWGNEYTFGTTGFSYHDYTRCGGVLGGSSSYTTQWGSLCYKTSGSAVYGGYFTSSTTGSGKSFSAAMTGIGLGAWGDLFGADIHGKVYGSYIEGENYAIFADGDVYKNKLDIHLQENGTENMTVLYTNVSTDATVQTYGTASLSTGRATIIFDPAFIASVSSETPVIVTVSPLGRSNGVYLSDISNSGFSVIENNDGKSNVEINFIAIGKRAGFENPGLAPEVISADYTGKLARGLHNDADTQTNSQGLYYENGKLQVGIHPSTLPDPNKPADDRNIPVMSSATDVQQEESAPAEIQLNVK
jgi:hypothetical protein